MSASWESDPIWPFFVFVTDRYHFDTTCLVSGDLLLLSKGDGARRVMVLVQGSPRSSEC